MTKVYVDGVEVTKSPVKRAFKSLKQIIAKRKQLDRDGRLLKALAK